MPGRQTGDSVLKTKSIYTFSGAIRGPLSFVGNGGPATTRLTESSRVKQPTSGRMMADTSGNREQTFPRKPTFSAILDMCCNIFIYIGKVGRLGLEPRTKALKGFTSVRCCPYVSRK
jgi:hypothetical protein